MTERHQLIAYIATLIAIVLLIAMGVVAACLGRDIEAVGVAAAVPA